MRALLPRLHPLRPRRGPAQGRGHAGDGGVPALRTRPGRPCRRTSAADGPGTDLRPASGRRLEYGKAIATGTFDAHCLLADAAHQGKAELMAERLFRAHFTDGLHVGDPATLARLAAEIGIGAGQVPAAELRARLDRVRRLGITGVPVFLVENLPPLTGSASETTLLAALRQAAAMKGELRDH
ncbi:DsbA family protein [Streptosporangium sp. NPDC048047]|uniref:DsbA family protein n=1 Tax=Streptosporangium sp. NPDC048047 TaxID=3155748 RepID=UPI00342F911D